jgi:hypothetical protein
VIHDEIVPDEAAGILPLDASESLAWPSAARGSVGIAANGFGIATDGSVLLSWWHGCPQLCCGA